MTSSFLDDFFYPSETCSETPSGSGGSAGAPGAPPKLRRLLVLADVHGNWPALESVLADAAGRYDAIWFLGDAVGYGPFPAECVAWLRREVPAARWRTGNHDLGLFGRPADFTWSGAAKAALAIHRRVLQEKQPDLWQWLARFATLQRCGPLVRAYGRGQQVWTHANLQNDLELYLFPSATHDTRRNLYNLRHYLRRPQSCGWLLAGHSHIPCLFQLGAAEEDYLRARPLSIRWGEPVAVDQGHYYLNAGSVGQPRDGNPAACYLLLDTQALTATWRRVAYPIELTVGEMRAWNRRCDDEYPVAQLAAMLENGGTARTVAKLDGIYCRVEDGYQALETSHP